MELNDDDVQRFIESWRADFGDTLAAEVARSEARRLLDFFATLEEAEGSDNITGLP
jgi:hypothetical protein